MFETLVPKTFFEDMVDAVLPSIDMSAGECISVVQKFCEKLRTFVTGETLFPCAVGAGVPLPAFLPCPRTRRKSISSAPGGRAARISCCASAISSEDMAEIHDRFSS